MIEIIVLLAQESWYSTYLDFILPIIGLEFFLEVGTLYLAIYYFNRFTEGTKGAGILKGLALLVLLLAVCLFAFVKVFDLQQIQFLMETFFTPLSAMAFVVILQPELRRGLFRISQAPIFGEMLKDEHKVLDEIIKSVFRLAKNRVGALIAIEREDRLKAIIDKGIAIDGDVSSELLTTIFYPGTDLHDGAVIIRNGRMAAAGCLFPLSESPDLGSWAGTRHRAAVGLSEECDAVTVVVSEERGEVSLCIAGKIHRKLDRESLEKELSRYYAQSEDDEEEEDSSPEESDSAAFDSRKSSASNRKET